MGKHDDIAELLGAYSLHALEPDERALVDAHLESCPRCRAEVREHEAVAAMLGNSGGDAPDGLWDRIASTLEEAPPPMRLELPPGRGRVVPLTAAPRPSRWRPAPRPAWLLVAAAAALIGVLGAQVVRQDHRIATLEQALAGEELVRAANLALVDPNGLTAELTSSDGSLRATGVVLPDGSGYLIAPGMPQLASDRTYQLWGQTEGGLVSLGLLGDRPDEVMAFEAGTGVSALAVTDEKAPGVVRSSNQPVLAGSLR